MATIQAFVRFDPERAPEQRSFLDSRVSVLREAGGQCWVSLDEAQVATLVAQGMSVQPAPEAEALQLGPLAWTPGGDAPVPPAALSAAVPAGNAPAYWLVVFVAPADKSWLTELALAGAEPVQTLAAAAGVWRMSAAVAEAVRALPEVAFAGLFHPAYVPTLALVGAQAPLDLAGFAAMTLALPASVPEGNLQVRSFDGVDPETLRAALEAAGAAIVSPAPQGFVLQVAPEAGAAVLSVPGLFSASPPSLAAVCNHNAGVIIGANQVRDLGTVNFLVNLDGLGEIGAVVDTGFDIGAFASTTPPATAVLTNFHPELAANIRLLANHGAPLVAGAVPDEKPHGTHVAGIVVGDGSQSAGQARGMAPRAALVGLGPLAAAVRPATQGQLPRDPRVPFDFAAQNGASVINNSWGASFNTGNQNRYTDNETRPVDRWCFDHPDVLVLFAAGNDESDTAAGGDGVLDASTLKLEATAKNVLTIGASENLRVDSGWRDDYRRYFGPKFNNTAFDIAAGTGLKTFGMSDNADEIALFSDRGQVRTPALVNTLRVKPDLVAPGTNILSARSQWVARPPALPPPPAPAPPAPPPPPAAGVPPPVPYKGPVFNDPFYFQNFDTMLAAGLDRNLYQVFHGTSMATPMVSGAALLVRQYYRTRHAQMRRPLLLEGVPLPAAPAPPPVFASRPSLAPHPDGLLFAWATPALAADAKRIVALRVGRHQAPVDAAPVLLQAAVGEHAALQVATLGEKSYLLHRHADGKLRLSCYDRKLAPVAAFGSAGVVTLDPAARSTDAVPPALLAVNNQLVCVWPVSADKGVVFQRFNADTGAAVDAAAVSLMNCDAIGPQQPLSWNGSRFAFCSVLNDSSFQLQVRQFGTNGKALGASAFTVLDQAQAIREPSLVWDGRKNEYLLVWVDARNAAGGELWRQRLGPQLAKLGMPELLMSLPAGVHLRRPQILLHPDGGYLLTWEDDSQDTRIDLYLATLDANAVPDGRTPMDAASGRAVLRLTDSPGDTNGHAVLADAQGHVLVYQNPDEVNADRMGVYALNLTKGQAFEAQEDPSTPWQKSGRYVTTTLAEHANASLHPLSAVWTGASWDFLRLVPGPVIGARLQWLRLTADGLPDARHGVDGLRERPWPFIPTGAELLWNGNDRRVAVVNDMIAGISVHLADADGVPVPGFGAAGSAALADTVALHDGTTPQLGMLTPPAFGVLVAYGSLQEGVLHLRQQQLDAAGKAVGTPAELLSCDGVAAHQWWQFANSEAKATAIYHRTSGANVQVLSRQFDAAGVAAGAEQLLSATTGEARNGVVARRPTDASNANREYAAAWQFRATAGANWEIRFSRLDRNGVPMSNPPIPGVMQSVKDFAVVNAAMPDWGAGHDAIEPQLVSTYTHEAWSEPPPVLLTPPEWSPSWGLAWIGIEPDTTRRLYFSVLDENGRRVNVPQPPPNPRPALPASGLSAPAPAAILGLSTPGANVRDHRLVWNGRVFLLTWTEEQAGKLRHMATLVNRHATRLAYDLPSAALLRATLVNGATNITPGPLPDTAAGYGWGRVNLRQSLAPALPVTFHARDDCALGPGRSVRYHFTLPPGTALLRVTLNWTDPPGPRLVNHLHLTVRAPGGTPEYRGNLWDTTATRTHLSRPVATPPVPADAHEDIQTFKQVVLENPAQGDYEVEVSADAFPADPFNQQNLQPFALVFLGTGTEAKFAQTVAQVVGAAVY
ncbi:S8 family serine peptidase [Ideonella azotifigens]|uniref:Peptidase S8/S53 domain-containing protein n=4 Tax=Ideonella azotifigens TaxID=513160 RepID=A0ABP3VBZ9_9BURK|nr:S8 family serine peptidase [Ideonella azotifigens]MCD2344851.1 S8 family serine peptidase [Ideonella azotifigens]